PRQYHENHVEQAGVFMKKSDPRQMGHGRDLHGRRKDGTSFRVEAGLHPFQLEDRRYVMALVTDISVRKQKEKRIIELNSQLEQKVHERTLALQQSIQEVKEEVTKRKGAELRISEALRKERELTVLKP